MRYFLVFLSFVLLLPAVDAICTSPGETEIKESAVFCQGFYNIGNGLNIQKDNIIVDCNNSILMGNGIGYGFLLKGRQNVVLENCNISNYEIGIFLENSTSIALKNNYLSKNKFGIAMENSVGNDLNDNYFSDNAQNTVIVNITFQQGKNEEINTQKKFTGKNLISKTPQSVQVPEYQGNKKIEYYLIYLAGFLVVTVAFYFLFYRFYYERRKLK